MLAPHVFHRSWWSVQLTTVHPICSLKNNIDGNSLRHSSSRIETSRDRQIPWEFDIGLTCSGMVGFGLVIWLWFCWIICCFSRHIPQKSHRRSIVLKGFSNLSMAKLNIASGHQIDTKICKDFISAIQLNGRFILGNLSISVVSTGFNGIVSTNIVVPSSPITSQPNMRHTSL